LNATILRAFLLLLIFCKIIECFDEILIEDFLKIMANYIEYRKSKIAFFNQIYREKFILFLFNLAISLVTSDKLQKYITLNTLKSQLFSTLDIYITEKPLIARNIYYCLEKILSHMHNWIRLFDKIDAEQQNLNSFDNQFNERMLKSIQLVSYLTSKFTEPKSKSLATICLRNLLQTTSFLYTEQENLLKFNHFSAQLISQFYDYLVDLIEKKFNLEFDEHFIMRHRFYGFEKLINKMLQTNSRLLNFNMKDLQSCIYNKNVLNNPDLVFCLLRALDCRTTDNQTILKTKLTELFWQTFEMLKLTDKIDLIYGINSQIEMACNIACTSDKSITCLSYGSFNSELTLVLNQLSSNSSTDSCVRIVTSR
jgi:hypothetical protein